MAGLIRIVQRAQRWKQNCSSPCSVTRASNGFSGTLSFGNRTYAAEAVDKSHFESSIFSNTPKRDRVPGRPATKFNSFIVEERPGEQVITMRGKFGDSESIKIEATMFNGYEHVPAPGDDSSGVNVRLHLSLIVDISKGESGNELEFVYSAWPECLNVEKAYLLRRGQMPARAFLGPDFRNLNPKIQEKLCKYLDTRGVNNELAVFLHDYMMNKDRFELLWWMDSLKSFVEK